MDRNTRIGFALIFLLLILWSVWMSRMQTPESQLAEGADSLSTEAPIETPPPLDPPVTDTPAPGPTESPAMFGGGERTQVVVETDLARFLVDSHGATLRRIELLEFDGAGDAGGFVELIGIAGADTASVLGVDVELPAGSFRTGGLNFTLDDVTPGGEIHLSGDDEATLRFRLAGPDGGELVKTYVFHGDRYDFDLGVAGTFTGAFDGARSLSIDWSDGLLSTEKNRKDDLGSFNSFYLVGDTQEKKSLRHFKGGGRLPERGMSSDEGSVQWLATKTKYFLAALIPTNLQSGRAVLVGDNDDAVLGWRVNYPLRGGRNHFEESFKVYTGPMLYDELKTYDRGMENLVDMGKLIRPISLAIKWLMDFLGRYIPNYGVIIVLLSVFTKVLFYRLTHKSLKSMKDMQAIQPELKALQEKYKDNKERLNKEMMALYKEHGVNPLGGCLPLLLQMPVFFALFRVLRGAVELRGAGFMLWIDDLSNMDVLYELPFAIPLLGGFIDNSISVLPILMGLSMWAQQKLGGSGMGMGAESAQAGQMAAMNKIMPFFMTFIFYRMPSGLVLYWLVNNILQVAQQWYIHKGLEKPQVVTAKS